MNKITIPAILVATVMVAGMFAFMPVEQASTVHTTIQGTQMQIVTDDSNVLTVVAGDTDAALTISSAGGVPFVLRTVYVQVDLGDAVDVELGAEESIEIEDVVFDGDVIITAIGDTAVILGSDTEATDVDALAWINDDAAPIEAMVPLASDGSDIIINFEMDCDATAGAEDDCDFFVRVIAETLGGAAITATLA